jgi:hypothetical protein
MRSILRRYSVKSRSAFSVALGFSLIFASCHRPKAEDMVVVRVFRDSGSSFRRELDSKLYSFNYSNQEMHVKSGKKIFVATMEGNYKDELAKLTLFKPQMIILDSSTDASLLGGMQVDLGTARNACGVNANCLAFVPPWVVGEELEATNMVFDSITRQPKVETPSSNRSSSR